MLPRLSLCLIAKNEEANLPACLQSAAGLVDEVIVVDTGSSDRTKEVAAGLGARVFDFAWCDSFSAARNESLRHATGDWVLWLDGDEHFDPDNQSRFRALVETLNGPAAYVMVQRSAPEEPGAAPTEVHQVRLFRNQPEVRWSYRVHEQILPAVRRVGHEIRWTDIAIAHTGYTDPDLRRKKTERNLRLLLLEYQEQPDDPFTLFNLGWAYLELGQIGQALPLLHRSLERSRPGDSIVHKLYALIAHAHRRVGQVPEALAVCRAGRARCPDDQELLFVWGMLLQEAGDLAGAEVRLRQLVRLRPGRQFASLDAGLRGPKARQQLAEVLRARGRAEEAEAEWRTLLAEYPGYAPAWLGLAEVFRAQGRWAELQEALTQVPAGPPWETEAAVLRARACLARRELPDARRLLEEAAAREPRAVAPRRYLTHALLQEGRDPAVAEQALSELLALDPRQPEAWRNLAVLLHQQGRPAEAAAACQSGLAHCPADEALLFQAGVYLAEAGDVAGAETCLERFLELPRPADDDHAGRLQQAGARHRLALLYRRQGRGRSPLTPSPSPPRGEGRIRNRSPLKGEGRRSYLPSAPLGEERTRLLPSPLGGEGSGVRGRPSAWPSPASTRCRCSWTRPTAGRWVAPSPPSATWPRRWPAAVTRFSSCTPAPGRPPRAACAACP
jgi:tetratricopeptide (TPR) repeat protein